MRGDAPRAGAKAGDPFGFAEDAALPPLWWPLPTHRPHLGQRGFARLDNMDFCLGWYGLAGHVEERVEVEDKRRDLLTMFRCRHKGEGGSKVQLACGDLP